MKGQDNLLVRGGFKQGTIWSKEKWSLEVKGNRGVDNLGAETLKTWISFDFEVMKVKFGG